MLNKGYKGYNVQDNLLYMRGGEEMYKRRGGFSYVPLIFRFKRHQRKMGFIGFGSFVYGALSRSVVSIVPNGFRTFLYSKVLRKQ